MSLEYFDSDALWGVFAEQCLDSGRWLDLEREGTDGYVRLSEDISIYAESYGLIIPSSPAVAIKESSLWFGLLCTCEDEMRSSSRFRPRGSTAVSGLGDDEVQIQLLDSHLDTPCWRI